jgi:hypothetical protein
MEGTLHDFQHIQDDLTHTPQLISDASSSDESFDEEQSAPIKKKKPIRTHSISNFLFHRNKEHIRTSSLLSQS